MTSCCFVGCFGALLGRLGVALLWLTGWFGRAGIPVIWIIVGFLIAPISLIWAGCVNVFYDGQWGLFQKVMLVVCLLIDLGGNGSPAGRKKR